MPLNIVSKIKEEFKTPWTNTKHTFNKPLCYNCGGNTAVLVWNLRPTARHTLRYTIVKGASKTGTGERVSVTTATGVGVEQLVTTHKGVRVWTKA